MSDSLERLIGEFGADLRGLIRAFEGHLEDERGWRTEDRNYHVRITELIEDRFNRLEPRVNSLERSRAWGAGALAVIAAGLAAASGFFKMVITLLRG